MRYYLKDIIPPFILNLYRRFRNLKYGWYGDFKSWEEAKSLSSGYEKEEILTKIRDSALKVKKGEAIYERDGVLFDEIQYSWPLLAGLMFACAKFSRLKVLDFGGSLGTSYFQNRKFLNEINDVLWCIVEQKHFVDVGKQEFEDAKLKFFYSVEECISSVNPNVLVLSSVLQYLEKPYEFLKEILINKFNIVILDLTPVSYGKEILTIQRVDPKIYNAQYPCWILDMEKIQKCFEDNSYCLLERFEALNGYKVYNRDGKLIGKYIGAIYYRK